MSRIGKKPVEIINGVTVTIQEGTIVVVGSKGELSYTFRKDHIKVEQVENTLVVSPLDDEKITKGLYGLTRTLIANMITGVTQGYERRLEIHGVGYRANATGTKIVLTVGFSHPVELQAPQGITVSMDPELKNEVIITGIDKQMVGEFAAKIRGTKPPEPYKAKGIRYKGEYIRRKAGKTAKK